MSGTEALYWRLSDQRKRAGRRVTGESDLNFSSEVFYFGLTGGCVEGDTSTRIAYKNFNILNDPSLYLSTIPPDLLNLV